MSHSVPSSPGAHPNAEEIVSRYIRADLPEDLRTKIARIVTEKITDGQKRSQQICERLQGLGDIWNEGVIGPAIRERPRYIDTDEENAIRLRILACALLQIELAHELRDA